MAKGPDPRKDPRPMADVPGLLRAGAAEFNARRFWHAHEAWEEAWHALRGAGRVEAAAYLRGMILVAAAFENASRGREVGFKRQLAEGLFALRTNAAARDALGLVDASAWEDALILLYVDACRSLDWARWNAVSWIAPPLLVA